MAKAYWISIYHKIMDPDKLAAYAKLAPAAIEQFGGTYLVRGNPAIVYESGKNERVVISVFPSLEKAIAAHDSPAYQEALRELEGGVDREIRIVEGLE